MWKLIGAAVIAAVAALIVRQVKPELAMFVQLGGILAVALLLMGVLRELLGAMEGMLQFAPGNDTGDTGGVGGNSPFTMLAKALGICVTTQLAADVCRDSGSGALANIVELGGRLLVLSLTLPLLKSIAELAVGLIRG
ncbi:MAG: stage III sporulation AC/AD family protein [Oscillospiraceae bacterium]|jgi:stage III sporulation protein AD|nr:stage III sporulation AC/AD family protein [Oscillospiraceae bacterium]